MKSILLLTFLSLTLVACDSKTVATTDYPLTTCVVSGEKLGDMGDPVILNHEGTEVRLCCKSCIDKFNADPAKYVAKLK